VTFEACERIENRTGTPENVTITIGGVTSTVEVESLESNSVYESCTAVNGTFCDTSYCVDDFNSWSLQGSRSDASFKYLRMSVYPCTGTDCESSTSILEAVRDSYMVISVGTQVPSDLVLVDDQEDRKINSSFWFKGDNTSTVSPHILMQYQKVLTEPEFFEGASTYHFPEVHRVHTYSEGRDDEEDVYMRATFELDGEARSSRILPTSLLITIARFGQVFALIWIANWFIRKFNFISFYLVADDKYYVPDIATRKILLSNRKIRLKDYENNLMYAFTFGGTDRFGLQTRHLEQFFSNRSSRFSRGQTQSVVEDVQRFMMAKRIGQFVSEERKMQRSSNDPEYDINTINRTATTAQSAALKGQATFDEDLDVDADSAAANRKCCCFGMCVCMCVPPSLHVC